MTTGGRPCITRPRIARTGGLLAGGLLAAGLLALAVWGALCLGVQPVRLADIWAAWQHYDPADPAQRALRAIRLPRLWTGMIAGAAFATAGTVMQALLRNPLADPGLLGVNAGAAFAVVTGGLWLGVADAGAQALLALPGAVLAAAAVFALGGGFRGDPGPVRLTLAGVALNALLLSLIGAIVLLHGEALDLYRHWIAGTLAQGATKPLPQLALLAATGAGIALWAAPGLEVLGLGHGLARGLGAHPLRVQGAALAAVTVLSAAGVAVAGPVGFLGLMVPPLARVMAGEGLRPRILISAPLGAALLLIADTAGRLILAPAEIRVGVMTAILGGPVFIWIARGLRPGETR